MTETGPGSRTRSRACRPPLRTQQLASNLLRRSGAITWTAAGFTFGGLGAVGYSTYLVGIDRTESRPDAIEVALVGLGLVTVATVLAAIAAQPHKGSRQAAVNAILRLNDDPKRCSEAPAAKAALGP